VLKINCNRLLLILISKLQALFIVIIFLFSESALGAERAQIFVPKKDKEKLTRTEYLIERGAILTVEEVARGSAGSFQVTEKNTWGFGYFNDALWIRLTIDLSEYRDENWFFVSNYEHAGILNLFSPNKNGGFNKQEINEKTPLDRRLFEVHNYLFKVPVLKNEITTYYVRVVPSGHVLTGDFLWANTKGIIEHMQDVHIGVGMFFGGLLVMWAYNAVLFVYLRSKAYFYYLYYLSSFILFFVYLNGFAPFFSRWSPIVEAFYAACGYTAIHGLILLGRHILLLESSEKRSSFYLDCYLRLSQWLTAIGAVATFFFPIGLPYQILNGIILGTIPVLMIAGVMRAWEGFIPARIYSLGWFMFSLGLAAVSMRLIGWVPSNWVTNYSVQIASVFEAIAFAVALAYRIKLIEQEKNAVIDEHAKRELKILEDERSRLEQRVTERTESLQASLESRRMMLANASHELRTPVNALRLLLDSTSNPVATDTTVIASVSTIANHMSQLVENLLLLDDLQQSGQRGPIQDFDLGDELRATAAMLGPLRHGSAAQFNLDVDACLGVMVRGDLTSLRRVIINLLSNAFKFTEQGAVSLTASVSDTADVRKRHCMIRVNDTGAGIAAPMHEQVFGAFVTSGGQVGHTGTGLGLAISRQLALNMNGSLKLVRSAPGIGSEFEFRACFDASWSPNFSAIEGVQSAGQEGLPARRLNVLVAEDDPITAQAVLLIVLQLRHDVTLAETYDELCTAFQRAEPAYDVALIDHRLPGGNGLTAIGQYRSSCPDAATRMILVTADVTPEVLNAARTICDEIVTKPTTAHVLRQLLGEGPPIAYQPTTDAREIVDAGPLKMLDRCGAQHQALIRMCATFNKTVGNTLIDIESRLAKCDGKDGSRADLEKIIHRMRGSCATIGATALAEDFKALAVCDSRVAAQRKYASMVDTFHRTRKALHDLLSKMKAA
jgi:signal transduction histidine kinase/CheY-like chemotaxis protein